MLKLWKLRYGLPHWDERWMIHDLNGKPCGAVEVLSDRPVFDVGIEGEKILKKAMEYLPRKYEMPPCPCGRGNFYNVGNILYVSAVNSAFLDLGIKNMGVAHPEHVWASMRADDFFNPQSINGDLGIVIYDDCRYNGKQAEHLLKQIEERFKMPRFPAVPIFAARLRASRDSKFNYGVRLDLADNSVVLEAPALDKYISANAKMINSARIKIDLCENEVLHSPSLENCIMTDKWQKFSEMIKKGNRKNGNVVVETGRFGMRTFHMYGSRVRRNRQMVRYEEPLFTTQIHQLDWFFWPARILLSGVGTY